MFDVPAKKILDRNEKGKSISANLTYAKEVNGLTQKGLDDYWQKERDIMSYIFAQSENASQRAVQVLLGEQDLTGIREQLDQKDNASKAAWWSRVILGDKGLKDLFPSMYKEK